MEVVNPFILKNKIGMVKFIDELCNVDFSDSSLLEDCSSVDTNNNAGRNLSNSDIEDQTLDPAHDLAVVYKICESYRVDIEQMAGTSQAARKLVTILTILSKHKQYYCNLRKSTRQSINTTLV